MRVLPRRIVDAGTQWMVLSAPVNNPTSGEGVDGTFQHRSHVTLSKSTLNVTRK